MQNLKYNLTIFTILLSFQSFSQTSDTIITTPILKSYFSYQTHTPLFVSYVLYHGGGECSRKSMSFKTDGLNHSATSKDYSHSGYDIGHMANAEDFANDCEKEKLTFYFYNALPQRAKLNRGCWEIIETNIREESQKDSLLIICGGYQFEKQIGTILVPSYCFKIIKNLKTKAIHCYLFPNDDSNIFSEIEIAKLLKAIPFGNTIGNVYHLN
jgi:endonuclease G, mitochondrial